MIIAKTSLKPFVLRHRVAFAVMAALVALTIYMSLARSGPHDAPCPVRTSVGLGCVSDHNSARRLAIAGPEPLFHRVQSGRTRGRGRCFRICAIANRRRRQSLRQQAGTRLGTGPTRNAFPVTKTAADGHLIYKTSYTIDSNLLRQTTSAPGERPIVFIGDSFTFGEGVDDASTMPQAFADLTGRKIPVLNLGYSGYGPSQPLRALQVGLFNKELGTPRAVVLLTSAWHAERTGCLAGFSARGPRYTFDGHDLSYRGPCASKLGMYLRTWLDQHRLLSRFSRITSAVQRPAAQDFETYAQIVGAIAHEVRTHYGAPLIVLYISSPEYLGERRSTRRQDRKAKSPRSAPT